ATRYHPFPTRRSSDLHGELQHEGPADAAGGGSDVEVFPDQRAVEADLHLARAGGEAGLDEVEPKGVCTVEHRQRVGQLCAAAVRSEEHTSELQSPDHI